MGVHTFGLDEVLSNLNKEIGRIENKAENGIRKAGALVLRESQKKVPVDFGVLKASGFMKMTGNRIVGSRATVGYTAEYALYVHENLEARHGPERPPFRRRGKTIGPGGPGQQAKYLENAVNENRANILALIRNA